MSVNLLTVKQAAESANISERTMQRHIDSGELAIVNMGTGKHKLVRIDPDDLRAFINQRKESARKMKAKNKMAGVIQFYK